MRYAAALLSLLAVPGWAQTLNQGERDYAMSSLHASRKLFLDAIEGVSEAQWNFKPGPGRASLAEIASGVIRAEDATMERVRQMLNSPATPGVSAKGDAHAADEQVYRRMANPSREIPHIDGAGPKLATPADAAKAFKERRDRTIRYVETTQDPLRAHTRDGLDAYQQIVALAGDTERRVILMNEVKSDPRFPK